MRLTRVDFEVYRDWIFILPSIVLRINDAHISDKNIELSIHWLVFHARLLFEQAESEEIIK